jgi:hypothetical protein
MRKITSFFLITIFSFVSLSKAQTVTVSKLINWKNITDKHHIEKIHIHTNLPSYKSYDTIWFKAYVLDAFYNKPSTISKLLNLELRDQDNNLLKRSLLRINYGLANGYFSLNEGLKSGIYHISAYTNNMAVSKSNLLESEYSRIT